MNNAMRGIKLLLLWLLALLITVKIIVCLGKFTYLYRIEFNI